MTSMQFFKVQVLVQNFLTCLIFNTKTYMQFTVEKATNSLNFLDVEIKMNDAQCDTSMWQKSTNTDLVLNFYSMNPTTWEVWLNYVFFALCQIYML